MGCTIENHTVTHPDMSGMSAEQIREEVRGCTEQIIRITVIAFAQRYERTPPYSAVHIFNLMSKGIKSSLSHRMGRLVLYLYYFRLQREDVLIHIGKIVII